MKKILGIICLALTCFAFTGCEPEAPTVESVAAISKTVGYAAGLAVNMSGIDAAAKTTIVTVVNTVKTAVPADGKTYAETWSPLIDAELAKLIADEKITADIANAISPIIKTAATGVDYLFAKHTDWKSNVEFVNAAVSGLTDGFLSVVAPTATEGTVAAPNYKASMDKEAYEYFKSLK